mgnify:CR=1 FL=1|jgi:hypothetical protein
MYACSVQDLTRAFCVLLKNCLTSPDLRERMVNDGAVRPLVQLLHKTEIRGAQRSPAVVAAAASAVWNISAHESAKEAASRLEPVARLQPRASALQPRASARQPHAPRPPPYASRLSPHASRLPPCAPQALVIKEHGVEALTEQLQNSQSEDVWQKCAGCLMVLAANSDKVKNLIGEQMGVKALTAIVKQPNCSQVVLKAVLGALAVLSSDDRNMSMMREEGMEQLIEKFEKIKDDRVKMFVKQLKDRLQNTDG